MQRDSDELEHLLDRLAGCFPSQAPLSLRPTAGTEAWARVSDRFTGGHAKRWFAATDGQEDEIPVYDAHSFCSLSEAEEAMRIADDIRAEPDGYWVEPQWLAIASDHSGQHIMIDDRDGRVLGVAHDDDYVEVLASSPEAWIAKLIEEHESGSMTWSSTFGLIETGVLEGIRERRAEVEARRNAPPSGKQKLGLGLTLAAAIALVGLLVWWLER